MSSCCRISSVSDIDRMANNAGLGVADIGIRVHEMPEEDWQMVM